MYISMQSLCFLLTSLEYLPDFSQNPFVGTGMIVKHESLRSFINLFNFSKKLTACKHPFKSAIIKV